MKNHKIGDEYKKAIQVAEEEIQCAIKNKRTHLLGQLIKFQVIANTSGFELVILNQKKGGCRNGIRYFGLQ